MAARTLGSLTTRRDDGSWLVDGMLDADEFERGSRWQAGVSPHFWHWSRSEFHHVSAVPRSGVQLGHL